MVMGGFAIALRVQENAGKAWPIARAVAGRLATDAGARDLYAKNPRLSESYPTAEAFVAAVAAQRSAFGALPPRPADGAFQSASDPGSLSVAAKGTGGGWMEMEVERSDGSAAGHAAIGEGITYLGFAADEPGLAAQRKSLRAIRDEARWARFRSVEQALLTDDGVDALLRANPDLAKEEAARSAFRAEATAWRPRLAERQPPATWKAAVDADASDEMVSMQRHDGPFGDRLQVGWRLKDRHSWLWVAWDNGRLSKVSLDG